MQEHSITAQFVFPPYHAARLANVSDNGGFRGGEWQPQKVVWNRIAKINNAEGLKFEKGST